MDKASYYVGQAERCARLARATPAKDVAERLLVLAAQYRQSAEVMNGAPGLWVGAGSGSR